MNTNLLKKGRSAIAIVLSLALVLTTASYPVSVAKASIPTIPVHMSDKYENPFDEIDENDAPEIVEINLPAGTTFVFFKQAKDDNVLWTLDDLFPGELDAIKAKLTGEEDSHDPSWTFIVGEGDHAIQSSNENVPVYYYHIWQNEDKSFTLTFDAGKVSHLYFGYTVKPKYEIEVTKVVTLNGAPTTLLDTSFYVALFDDEDEMIGEKQEIKVEDGTALNKALFTVTDPADIYYVFEVDEDGYKLSTGIEIQGYTLQSIDNQGSSITNISPTSASTLTITNNLIEEEEETGQIDVTKEVVVAQGSPEVNDTFYAGLFTKVEGQYKIVTQDDKKLVVELVVSESKSDTKSFTNLDLNETYYVFETVDENGVPIDTSTDGSLVTLAPSGWTALKYQDNVINLVPSDTTPEATITNYFDSYEGGLTGSIAVVKTVTVNKKPFASNLTFHVGLFSDKELTKESLIDVQDIVMGGQTNKTVYFNDLDAGFYYIAETNASGDPLTGTAKELGFEIQINGDDVNNATVELIEDEVTVNLVNNFKKEEFPLTGDSSNMNLWLFLAMLGVAGAIAPFAFRKKEEAND